MGGVEASECCYKRIIGRILVVIDTFCKLYQCQFPGCESELPFYKICHGETLGKRYMRSLYYFVQPHVNPPLSQNKMSSFLKKKVRRCGSSQGYVKDRVFTELVTLHINDKVL